MVDHEWIFGFIVLVREFWFGGLGLVIGLPALGDEI